jgi:prepilin-type N-terminal cleavage/methylation domain-containing protein/prepilin-type processing-associated H-X9-DG protein
MNSIESYARPEPPLKSPRAFTLIELLVVLALLAMLAAVAVPALARTKPNSHRFQCLNNLNQITVATAMYAHDNHDLFPPNPDDPGDDTPGHHWVSNLNQGGVGAYNPDVLLDPTHSVITTYLATNINVFKCPADTRLGPYSGGLNHNLFGQIIPATRSISMNGAVGTVCAPFWRCQSGHNGPPVFPVNGSWLDGSHANGCSGNITWSTFGKTTSFRTISAAMVFMVCDEHPYSINDGGIETVANPANPVFIDYPASWHNGGCGFSFCDGHTEIHKWKGSVIKTPSASVPVTTANDMLDWTWLAQHSSARDH